MTTPKEKAFHLPCRLAVGLLSLFTVYGTTVPFLRVDHWWIRVFDFPRIQLAVLMVVALAGYAALRHYGRLRPWEHALAAMVGLGLVWQGIFIAPYTAVYPKEMATSRAEDDSNRISILVYNVLHDNREVDALRDLIRDTNPDVILLSEPTQCGSSSSMAWRAIILTRSSTRRRIIMESCFIPDLSCSTLRCGF